MDDICKFPGWETRLINTYLLDNDMILVVKPKRAIVNETAEAKEAREATNAQAKAEF